MMEAVGSTPEEIVLLREQLKEQGPTLELLLKAIAMLDSDIDGLRSLLAPIMSCTVLLLENRDGNLTNTQLKMLEAMKETEHDLTSVLDTAKALTTNLHGYWGLVDEWQETTRPVERQRGVEWEREVERPRATGSKALPETRSLRPITPVKLPALDELPVFLTVDETAIYLDLPSVVVHSISALRPVRVNDRYLYRTADVERFGLEMGTIEPQASQTPK
jgi:hypothetical protein